jgi:multidrug resistance efflux pump
MKKAASVVLTIILIGLIGVGISYIWNQYMYTPWTRDARVRATVISIAPDVSGWVDQLHAENAQTVKAGQVLFTVDSARYDVALEQAQAQAETARVDWLRAKSIYERRGKLNDGSVSAEEIDLARLDMLAKLAVYKQAQANVDAAQLDVTRTVYTAPADGTITNLALEKGDYVTRGVDRLALVKADSYYVTGYFEETKIPSIRVGDKVNIWLMAGSLQLKGHVESIDSGISNENTTPGNQMLPSVSATFAWIRLAQRIPVDIKIDSVPAGVELSSGMSATVKVDLPLNDQRSRRSVLHVWNTDFGAVLR